MSASRPVAVLLFALGLVACGGRLRPEANLTSSSGTNTMTIIVDGVAQTLASTILVAQLRQDVVELHFAGEVDPEAGLADDEHTYHLYLQLDRAAYDAMVPTSSVTVSGAASYVGVTAAPLQVSWQAGAGGSGAVVQAWVSRACFCADEGTGAHTVQGTVTFTRLQGLTAMGGALELTATGDFINFGGGHTIEFRVSFDLVALVAQ